MLKTLSQKKLNPETGQLRSKAQLESTKKYYSSKRGHLSAFKSHAMQRAKASNVPFDIDLEYLESIATTHCPVFKQEFRWGRHHGKYTDFTPSLDRIVPELGYIKGNIVFISVLANRIKNNATEKELYAVADWLHDERKRVLNAQKRTVARVSKTNDRKSKGNA